MSKKYQDFRVVFSTNKNATFEDNQEEFDIEKSDQVIRVIHDRKNRKGKTATVASGFKCSAGELSKLAKMLKSKLGVGGSAKNNEIIIQGAHADRIVKILLDLGYTNTKRKGGN